MGCSSSSRQVNGEVAAWWMYIVNKSQSMWKIHILKSQVVSLIAAIFFKGRLTNEAVCACLTCDCVFLGVQSSLLFLIWQLFYSLSEVIFTDGRYISAARRRLVFRDPAALPELTTKSLSRTNQTITAWDCCWNRVTFPVSWLSLWPFTSAFSLVHINSVFFKLTIVHSHSQLVR